MRGTLGLRIALGTVLGLSTLSCAALPLRGPLLGGPAIGGVAGSTDALPVRPSVGFLFEQYTAPIQTNVQGVTLGPKVGRATTIHFRDPLITQLPLITYGEKERDMAVAAAAQAGEIEEIDLIEVERFSVLGIYIRETIVVRGD